MEKIRVTEYDLANIIYNGYFPKNWRYVGNGYFEITDSEERIEEYRKVIKEDEFRWAGGAEALMIEGFIKMLERGE